MHTRSSNLYRTRRIPTHQMQLQASILVMLDLRRRYGERADRHWGKILAALARLEVGLQTSQRTASVS